MTTGAGSYKVVSGDTGIDIASKLGVPFDKLSAVNLDVSWNELQVGQDLNIPSSGGGSARGEGSGDQSHYVVAGDTGSAIAQRFGFGFEHLSAANPGVNWDNLSIGQALIVPSRQAEAAGGGSEVGKGVLPPPRFDDSGMRGGGRVKQYSGPASKFPDPAGWQKWSLMWARDSGVMCINNSAQETAWVEQAIHTVARETGVDRRIILAMIMQESQGKLRVNTTYSADGIRNAGLMQSHNGVSFDANDPQGSILQMIRDGVQGTQYGDGLVQLVARHGNVYAAVRGYNSGSVDTTNLSYGFSSTPSYTSDIANRLVGAPPN